MNSKNTTRIPEYLSTHPSGETRIDELISQLPTALNVFNIAQDKGLYPDCRL